MYFKGSCVRYFETRKPHPKAKEACRSDQAELLSLSYEQDIDAFPAPPKPTMRGDSYYVGLEYNRSTSTWFWSSGEPLTYNAKFMEKNGSCGALTMNTEADKRRYVSVVQSSLCETFNKLPFICQRFGRYTTFMETL